MEIFLGISWEPPGIQVEDIFLMNRLTKSLGIVNLDDWHSVTLAQVRANGGSTLLQKHQNSLPALLRAHYPNHRWLTWRFPHVPRGHFDDPQNRAECVNWLAERLGIDRLDGWYEVSVRDVSREGGRKILRRFGDSLSDMLVTVYPDHEWEPWKFKGVPKGFWDERENQRRFGDWLGKQLGIKELGDWYNVTSADVISRGGAVLMDQYAESLSHMLSAIYPNHEWQVWMFSQVSRGSWEDGEVLGKFVKWLEKRLDIWDLEDWYRVSLELIETVGSSTAFKKNGGIAQVLGKVYPNHGWDSKRLTDNKQRVIKSSQWRLKRTVDKLFPGKGNFSFNG